MWNLFVSPPGQKPQSCVRGRKTGKSELSEKQIRKLTALIKETGFIEIPSESFPVKEGVIDYQKSNVKIILNGQIKQIHWPEQNATEKFIPPIITMVGFQLDQVITQISE